MNPPPYTTTLLRDHADAIAPDGSEVRLLVELSRGSLAHFTLPARKGEMWRAQGEEEDIVTLQPGVALSIPTGCSFQFRAGENSDLEAVGVAMPPWPGEHEAAAAEGPWDPTA